jgi:hypothetical protein
MIALALIENLFKTNFQWDDDDDVDEDRLTLVIFFLSNMSLLSVHIFLIPSHSILARILNAACLPDTQLIPSLCL